MKEPQDRIQTLLDRLVVEGRECGVQVAAYCEGRLIVNAWAGIADATTGDKVQEETLFPIFSVGKGMVATIIHRLVERGLLSYEMRIAEAWPEFSAHGKEEITVRQALNHSSGLPQMPPGIGFSELCNWEAMCWKIAGMEPLWPPGTRMEYHAMTYGWILGELARRVSGSSFAELLENEIRRPLGIEAMYVGIPEELEPRVAILDEPGVEIPSDNGEPQSIPFFLRPLHGWMNRSDSRRACIPASNGVMNALAIARHYAALLPDGADGIQLLSDNRVRIATEVQHPDRPQSEDYPRDWGLGYRLGGEGALYGGISAFGHAGYGGSNGFADPQAKLAFGFTKNLFQKEDTARLIVNELRDAISRR